jgi:Fur family peroxide stress response transcriptional regulator
MSLISPASPTAPETAQDAVRVLRQAGLKATPQRLALLRELAGDQTHPTAQELFERLSDAFPSLSVATVYNTLAALTRVQRCRPLELGGPVRFDPNVEPHDHAVCERCGSIRDVPAAVSGSASATHQPTALAAFQVRRVERIYRGLCAACAQPLATGQ